jgi:glyoxalase family protein
MIVLPHRETPLERCSMKPIKGLHHVTALAGDPQGNVDFYVGVLGLRLVKRTVNFDDPGTWHLYYGDETGSPGSILTFFPWPGAPRGRRGTGQTTETAFAVPPGSLDWWIDRLAAQAAAFDAVEQRFGDNCLPFYDPDGLKLELVEQSDVAGRSYWKDGPVPEAQAIRGFHSVTLTESGFERTADLLVSTMGFKAAGAEGSRYRYVSGTNDPGSIVDLICAPELRRGSVAVGTVHHIAFRSVSNADQLEWRERVAVAGIDVTPVMDRQYFHSIYFREPGGVLFEIATDPPGFGLDESPGELGSALRLPPWLEPHRGRIEERLLPIRSPVVLRPRR